MVEIVSSLVEQYIKNLLPARDPALAAIEEEARATQIPAVGPLEGAFLHLIARATGARRILEVGTATGYSAIWLGRAVVTTGGHVTGIELDPARAAIARQNVRRCGLESVIEVREGDAFQILPMLSGTYDLIFVDILRQIGDSVRLGQLFDRCVPLIRVGGVLLSDNVLHGGDVATGGAPGIRQYNLRLMTDPRLTSVIVPLRDGVGFSLRVR
ncbi:MAG: O-methyltransferase [Chloroflexi bacterium]|nr:O-methyltransferase [Chloroflexota bacterium]